MTMMAPAGSPSVISPLTTQVSAKMASGMSLDAAKTAVQTELGLTSIDVTKNYVLEKATNSAYTDAHKVAASVAEVLKNIDTQSSSSTTLASKLSALTTQVTSSVAPIATQIKSAASLDAARTAVNTQISSAVNIYSIGGSISGLSASGLILANGTNTVSPSSGATSFTFSTQKATSATYAVTVQANPTGQTCAVANASGTVASQSISNIAVTCTSNPGALSGTITGLTTSGLVIKNGSDELTVSSGASTFQLGSTVASGAAYSVTIKTQPTGKTCSVANGSGTMTSAGVSNVQVTCATNSYTLSGSISGLVTSGLKLKNGSETLTISSGSSAFIFSTQVSYGGGYSVTVDTQPTGYTCSLSNSSGTMGTANVTAVQVTCAINSYSLSGSISGLVVPGLKIKNGSETLTITSGATSFGFTNSVAYGGSYSVSVDTQPSGYTCTVSNGSGVASANISNVIIACGTAVYTVSTLAGGGGTGSAFANGTGTNARFANPWGLAVDSSGNIYVADYGNHLIRKITSTGVVTTYAGSGQQGAADGESSVASFNYPSGIAIDSSGNLYVADTGNCIIRKISTNGTVTTLAGTARSCGTADGQGAVARFGIPAGIAVDSSGNVYVADTGNSIIRKVTPAGAVSTLAGSIWNACQSKITADGYYFCNPYALTVDSSGNVYVADTNNELIRKITSTGIVSTLAGGRKEQGYVDASGVTARFTLPQGIAIDSNSNLYIGDYGNHGIRYINADGLVSTLTGSNSSDFSSADSRGIAVDSAGNIYVADWTWNIIRKMTRQ
jgi:sugar lactone lactonase YvrE